MELHLTHCAGLDGPTKPVVACCRTPAPAAAASSRVTRTFGTTRAELLALSDWLSAARVPHVGLERTGVYWKPVFNRLAGNFTVFLLNAPHVKNGPGRKTAVQDDAGLAQLLA